MYHSIRNPAGFTALITLTEEHTLQNNTVEANIPNATLETCFKTTAEIEPLHS